ncbi:hypothetical protein FB567DRAFT_587840 [Paraphoma chrysanthemicola]|uniref:Uncharacterized protein n=1 Tax=Paraphoma chrysanthemicola TaxID=798071 RepID=A0A8K0RG36_9PLEO|nr:hypothetical protein FB567DRAFT_587840 [Paraphoma chrysanthemicola]
MSTSTSSSGVFTRPKILTTGIILGAAVATTALVLRLDLDVKTITSMPTAKASSNPTSSMSKFAHPVHKHAMFPSPARIAAGAYPSRRRLKLLGWYLDGKYEQTLELRGVLEHSLAVEIHLNEMAYKVIPRSMGMPCRLEFAIEPKVIGGDMARVSLDSLKETVAHYLRDSPVRQSQLRLTEHSHWDSEVKAALLTLAVTKCHTYDTILAQHAGLATAILNAFGPALARSMVMHVDCHELLAHNIPPPGFANCMPQVTAPAPYEEEEYYRHSRHNRPKQICIPVFADPNEEAHVRGLPDAIDMATVQYTAVNKHGQPKDYLRPMDLDYYHKFQRTMVHDLKLKTNKTAREKRKKARAARLARIPKFIEIPPMPTHEDDPEYNVTYNGFMNADGTYTNIPVGSPSLEHNHNVQTALLLQKRGPLPETMHYVKDASRECELGSDYFGEGYRRLGNKHYNDEVKVEKYGLVALYQQCGPEAYQLFRDNKHDAMCYFDQHPEHFEMIKGEPWVVARERWCNNREHVTPVPAEAPVAQQASAPEVEGEDIDQEILADPAILKVVKKKSPRTSVPAEAPAAQAAGAPEIEGEDIDQEILADPAVLKVVKKKSPRSSVSSTEYQDPFDCQRPHGERICGEHRASQDAFEQALHKLAEPPQQSGDGFGLVAQAKLRAYKQQAQQSVAIPEFSFMHNGFRPDHVYAGVDVYREWERRQGRACGPPPGLSNTRRPTPEDTPSPTQRPPGYAVRGLPTGRVPPGFAFKSAEERDNNMKECVAAQYNHKNYGPVDAELEYVVHEDWTIF